MALLKVFDSTPSEWESHQNLLPKPHFLQSAVWGDVKSKNGWKAYYKIWKNENEEIVAGAMILERRMRLPLFPDITIQYVPKGPLVNWHEIEVVKVVLHDLVEFSRHHKAIFIKIDPDVYLENLVLIRHANEHGVVGEQICKLLREKDWTYSESQVQFLNTMWLDLQLPLEDILKAMKQKTRYNIRLAEKKGVKIRIAEESEYPLMYQLYAETSLRDGFVIRPESYYLDVWLKFKKAGICDVLIAEFENQPIAGLVLYHYFDRAYYIYGMSSDEHRNLMASYLIQWKAIQLAQQYGSKYYDMWGAPDELNEDDAMFGVYRFKLGFNGEFVRSIGAWDHINSNLSYTLYQRILPGILSVMRKVGRKKTAQSLD